MKTLKIDFFAKYLKFIDGTLNPWSSVKTFFPKITDIISDNNTDTAALKDK